MYGRVQVVEAHQDGLLKCHSMDLQHQLNCDCDHDTDLRTEELQDQTVVLFDSVVED